ncbi:mitochondrial inner membrane protease subunit 1 [Sporodiniella umbellata]|nr:mitochondrial inner membrane protease subunit 1 [Sporodiniella umbellata]
MGRFFSVFTTVTKWSLQFACFSHLFNEKVFEFTQCEGPSMLPYYEMYGILAVEKISKHYREYEIGDVLVCGSPHVPGRNVLKRVIGVQGDSICVDPTLPDREYIVVPKGHVWLGGDNMSNSIDSRIYGPVPLGLVKGRVFAKIFPVPEIIHNITKIIA